MDPPKLMFAPIFSAYSRANFIYNPGVQKLKSEGKRESIFIPVTHDASLSLKRMDRRLFYHLYAYTGS